MPLYSFSNPQNPNETIDIFMSMNDKHEYIKDGIKWNRIFYKPQAAIDTKINPLDCKDFMNKTREKHGTLGNIQDLSAELSQKREKIIGKDPIKEKYYENWQKKRKRVHPDIKKKQVKEILSKKGVDIEN